MLKTQPDGSLRFCRKRQSKIFIFRKDNYDRHCKKRGKLYDKSFLGELENTLFEADVITSGPPNDKRTYYKIFNNEKRKYNTWVRALQVPVFQHKKNKRIYFIATTFDFDGYNWQIIHDRVEKIIWRKKDSLI